MEIPWLARMATLFPVYTPCRFLLGVLRVRRVDSERSGYVTLLYQTKYCSNCGKSVGPLALKAFQRKRTAIILPLTLSLHLGGPIIVPPFLSFKLQSQEKKKQNSCWQILCEPCL